MISSDLRPSPTTATVLSTISCVLPVVANSVNAAKQRAILAKKGLIFTPRLTITDFTMFDLSLVAVTSRNAEKQADETVYTLTNLVKSFLIEKEVSRLLVSIVLLVFRHFKHRSTSVRASH